jgi:hypothetical protein
MFVDRGVPIVCFVGKFGSGLRQYVREMHEVELAYLVHPQVGPRREEIRSVGDGKYACCKDVQSDADFHLHHPLFHILFDLLPCAASSHERPL